MSYKKKQDILNKKAVALEYKEEMKAPIINAKGRAYVAENMLEKEKKNNIPTYFDEQLLNSLMALSVGDEIPQELYEIVSKVLQYVQSIDKKI